MAKGKKNSSDKKYDSERETRVLLEKIHSDVKTIAEGQSSNSERLTRIESTVNKLTGLESEVQYIKMAVIDTNKSVKSIEKKLDNHETRLSKVEEKIHT